MTSQAPIALSMLVVGAIAGVAVRLFKKRSEPLSTLAPLAMAATTGVREPSRRDVLAGTVMATLAAQAPSPALAAPKTAAELAIQDLRTKVGKVIAAKVLSGEVDISVTDVLRLAVHDALTYDPETKRGCFNGSIRFPEELKRPENAGLAPAVEKLLALQKAIKAEVGRDISFADISAITGLFIISESFKAALCSKTAADACGTAVPFNKPPKPVGLGRIDAESPDPEGQIPWTGSSVEDFKAAGKKIGIVSKELMALLPALLDDEAKAVELFMQDGQCAGIIKSLEQSKTTQTRTTYEIALYAAYLKLVNFARFSSAQYYP
jgi:L-ascorbate peroxidase